MVSTSPSAPVQVPVKNSSISSTIASVSPTKNRWSSPGRTTNLEPGMCSARYRPDPCRLARQYLTGSCQVTDSLGDCHGQTSDVVSTYLDLPGVHPSPKL
jgi:hypothetical protein